MKTKLKQISKRKTAVQAKLLLKSKKYYWLPYTEAKEKM